MDTYFIPWVITHYHCILFSQFSSLGALSVSACVPLTPSEWGVYFLCVHLLALWHCKMPQAHLVYFLAQSLNEPLLRGALDPFIRSQY